LGKRLSSLVALIPALLVAFIYAPAWLGTTALLIALITMVMTTSLKAAALFSQISHRVPTQEKPLMCVPKAKLPRVSVLVPLFREERIAEALINRLSRLTYPKALLEIVLVLEERTTSPVQHWEKRTYHSGFQ
jgi:cellulose synthase/poly-beta-1,6-N-acetylglucosamine synthase-like glycosyltransferase